MKINHAAIKAVECYITAVLRNGRTHACVQQFLDLADDLGIFAVMVGVAGRGRCLAHHHRLARLEVLHDRADPRAAVRVQRQVEAEDLRGRVRLAVRDDGPGIRRDALARIFEPFFTSDDAQGSGLGLAIARELAERMQGRLTVESLPGRTTFSLELPA